jgi:hypothetical protein
VLTGNLAFTSAKAFPATPLDTVNWLKVWTERTPARLSRGAARDEVASDKKTVTAVEKRMLFDV